MREGLVSYLSTRMRQLLLEAYAAAYMGYKVYFRYPMTILSDVVTTPLWTIIFLVPILLFLPREQWSNPITYEFFYWGMIFWDIVSMALWGIGSVVRSEQQLGTIEYLFLSNANRVVMFLSRVATRVLTLMLDACYFAAAIYLLFGVWVRVVNPFLLILVMLLSLYAAVGFGALYAALVLKLKSPGALSNILQFVIMGLSGVFFPVSRLPEQVRPAAYVLPFSYGVDLVRAAAIGTETMLSLPAEILVLAVYGLLLNAAGLLVLKHIEASSKRTGKLGAY